MYRVETSKDGQNWRESERRFVSPEGAKLHAESWISMGIHYATRVVVRGQIIAEYHQEEEEE